ncbi:hypothetical protein DL96DRAFT_1810199 [Flagelloscypha sp. PMI_526]|nr:hypothetical protein DL96DRAFT_1810199 [Flagelloscypha sp. PMI_526]
MRLTRPLLSATRLPWFVEPAAQTLHVPLKRTISAPPLPDGVPFALKTLHAQLLESPHLDSAYTAVSDQVLLPSAPPLPLEYSHGRRRKRGGNFSGHEDGLTMPSTIWDWVLFAQVKEGTESRGAIESVVRVIRKTLLGMQPPVLLPTNSKQRMQNGWAMVDAGQFAVHILSREARLKYFGDHEILPNERQL